MHSRLVAVELGAGGGDGKDSVQQPPHWQSRMLSNSSQVKDSFAVPHVGTGDVEKVETLAGHGRSQGSKQHPMQSHPSCAVSTQDSFKSTAIEWHVS